MTESEFKKLLVPGARVHWNKDRMAMCQCRCDARVVSQPKLASHRSEVWGSYSVHIGCPKCGFNHDWYVGYLLQHATVISPSKDFIPGVDGVI